MKKLFLMGDSVMKGVMLVTDRPKYRIFGDECFSSLESRGVTVSNRSKMGATVTYGKDALTRSIGECDTDSGVIFEYGGNDCDYDWQAVAERPDGEHLPHTSPEKFRAVYTECITRAKASGLRAALANLIPIDAEKYFGWISRGLNAKNILRWLGDISMLYRWQEYYSKLVEEIARDCHCPLIDLRNEFLLSHNYKNLLCDDGIHPTETGHKLLRSIIDNSADKVLM